MALINLTTLFGGVSPLHNINAASVNFKGDRNISAFQFEISEPSRDKFSTNPSKTHFKSKAEIEQLAKSNPRIMALLKEHNLPLCANMDVLEGMI